MFFLTFNQDKEVTESEALLDAYDLNPGQKSPKK